jgi:hypothetical protein
MMNTVNPPPEPSSEFNTSPDYGATDAVVIQEPAEPVVQSEQQATEQGSKALGLDPSSPLTKEGMLMRIDESPMMGNDRDQLRLWAQDIATSGTFPNANTTEKVLALSLLARDLGIKPSIAFFNIHMINGKPSLPANLCAALVKKQGVRYIITSDYVYCTNPSTNQPDYLTRVVLLHSSYSKPIPFEFWFSEAVLAGWTKNDNWQRMPKIMQRWRTLLNAVRFYFPEMLMGIMEQQEAMDAKLVPDGTFAAVVSE